MKKKRRKKKEEKKREAPKPNFAGWLNLNIRPSRASHTGYSPLNTPQASLPGTLLQAQHWLRHDDEVMLNVLRCQLTY